MTNCSDLLFLLVNSWKLFNLCTFYVNNFFFLQKAKKIVNITCSGAIRDHKTSIQPQDSKQPLLSSDFHTQSEGSLGPCWLRLKKKKKKESELERMPCLHLNRGLPNWNNLFVGATKCELEVIIWNFQNLLFSNVTKTLSITMKTGRMSKFIHYWFSNICWPLSMQDRIGEEMGQNFFFNLLLLYYF